MVNDIGVGLDGSPAGGGSAAQGVVDEITAAGGEAVANGANVADWSRPQGLIQTARRHLRRARRPGEQRGHRARPDVRQHQRGRVRRRDRACTSRATSRRCGTRRRTGARSPRRATPVDARIINTSSGAGLQGSVGQGNYSAAKAGIAAMTLVAAAEMGRYGVTVNAIAPSARTRMTETVFADMMSTQDDDFDAMAPENISPLVVWLGSAESRDVTGQDVRGRGRHHPRRRGLGARARRSTRAPGGIPPSWARSSPTCWPRRARRFRSTARRRVKRRLVACRRPQRRPWCRCRRHRRRRRSLHRAKTPQRSGHRCDRYVRRDGIEYPGVEGVSVGRSQNRHEARS